MKPLIYHALEKFFIRINKIESHGNQSHWPQEMRDLYEVWASTGIWRKYNFFDFVEKCVEIVQKK